MSIFEYDKEEEERKLRKGTLASTLLVLVMSA